MTNQPRAILAVVLGVGCGLVAGHQVGRADDDAKKVTAPSAATGHDARPPKTSRRARPLRIKTQAIVEEDSTKDGYDAMKLVTVLNWRIVKVFEAEQRNPQWADSMESVLRAKFEHALTEHFPRSKVSKVECKAASCQTSVSVPAEYGELIGEYIQGFVPPGDVFSVDWGEIDGESGAQILTFESVFGAMHSAREFDSTLDSHWARMLPKFDPWYQDAMARYGLSGEE